MKIEEAINQLRDLQEDRKSFMADEEEKDSVFVQDYEAIEAVLSELERLQKENEELKADLYSANSIINEYIDTYKDCISKEIELSSEDVKAMLENPEKYFKIRTACYKG